MNTLSALQILLSVSCNDVSCDLSQIPTWDFVGNHWVYMVDQGTKPVGSPNCPGGDMVEIDGEMAVELDVNPYGSYTIDHLQKATCTKWINKDYPERCSTFDQVAWEKIASQLPRKNMHFCIDPYEWPNQIGAAPWIMVTWNEAKNLCKSNGKRLCTEDEWTFACEGENVLPHPYGYERDSTKCNIDRPWKLYNGSVMLPRGTKRCGDEMWRLWQGHASGTDKECVSSFGVHDMTGNVDEWTTATRGGKYPSILKGGYWSRVRTRCRPSTRNHRPDHAFYQQGFRCCANSKI